MNCRLVLPVPKPDVSSDRHLTDKKIMDPESASDPKPMTCGFSVRLGAAVDTHDLVAAAESGLARQLGAG